jgi:pyruvate ferredoxin oxidoreductase alpha subunit
MNEKKKKNEKRELVECSQAIAHAVKQCKPGVIAAYPITPQTHIVERLAEIVADGELNSEFIDVESEHSAMSASIGASATGVRTFTASSSQGIALMHEMLFIASGMRLPIVMAVANRALSAPINIWNDHSDTMAERDSSWLQFYCENSQEAYDTTLMAYKISETRDVMLPSMICIDGFTLSHLWEPIESIDDNKVDLFLPNFSPVFRLDASSPKTFGSLAFPNTYMQFKQQQHDAMLKSVDIIKKVNSDFRKRFGRGYGDGLIETYMLEDAKIALIAIGSVCSTSRIVIDRLRKEGKKVGLIKIKTFRPFPIEELRRVAKGLSAAAVIDRAVSFGSYGPLFLDVKSAVPELKINNFIVGLGGRDINEQMIEYIIKKIGQKEEIEWVF